MTLYDKIAYLRPKSADAKWQYRIWTELLYAADVSTAGGHIYDADIEKAADFVAAALKEDGAVTSKTVFAAEKLAETVAPAAKGYTGHCVGHAHIDMNWMWGYNETVAVTVDTFRTVLDLMEEYPGFTFAQSQASTYRIIEENAPEMIEEIKRRVHEGRWEVSASTWVENDKNMPGGEALARHILYSKRYLSKLLDISPDSLSLDFEPDTFGHNISVPEVCARGGVKYYYHCRGREDVTAAYVWKSRAGSELLVYNEPHWYNSDINAGNFCDYPQRCAAIGTHDFLVVYGVGDHGGGPTRRDIEHLLDINTWPIMPTLRFSTYSAFFDRLNESRACLPVYTGEFNCTFTGCYTSQSRIKMANRLGEDRLYEAEFLDGAASALAGEPAKNKVLAGAWEKVLFNQFHDILPGSGTIETREYAMGRFQSAMAAAQTTSNNCLRAIAAAIDTSALSEGIETDPESLSDGAGVGFNVGQDAHFAMPVSGRGSGKKRIFHLFNSTGKPFEGTAKLIVWDWNYSENRAVWTDERGERTESSVLNRGAGYWGHESKTFAVKAKVPAYGYATYVLNEGAIEDNIQRSFPTERVDRYNDGEIILENDKIKAVFDHKSMQLVSLTDKACGRTLIDRPSARFLFVQENTVHGMTAWRVGDRMKAENLNAEKPVTVWDRQDFGLVKSVKYALSFGERSKLEVTVSLSEGSSALEFNVRCDFHEVGTSSCTPQLCFEAPLSYAIKGGRFDVPFGTIDREAVAHDLPARSFACALPAAGRDEPACVLVTDTKYGFRLYDDALTVNLIRGSSDPDPYPEYGMHDIRIGLGTVLNPSGDSLYSFAEEFIHPVFAVCARKGSGKLPLSGSLLSASGARVNAIKTKEDGNGLIVRLFDMSGRGGAYELTPAFPCAKAFEADLNENPEKELAVKDGKAAGAIGAYEIKTVILDF